MNKQEAHTLLEALATEITRKLVSSGHNVTEQTKLLRKQLKAIDMAIEALKQPSDETQLLDDGTLKIKVANVLDIKRIMVMDDNVIYDSYYPERPKGEWKYGNGNGECPFCGRERQHGWDNYCGYCGARMRE